MRLPSIHRARRAARHGETALAVDGVLFETHEVTNRFRRETGESISIAAIQDYALRASRERKVERLGPRRARRCRPRGWNHADQARVRPGGEAALQTAARSPWCRHRSEPQFPRVTLPTLLMSRDLLPKVISRTMLLGRKTYTPLLGARRR